MRRYSFKCLGCGDKFHTGINILELTAGDVCVMCRGEVVRDYKADNPRINRENIRAVPRA